jgi:hypothetical protein
LARQHDYFDWKVLQLGFVRFPTHDAFFSLHFLCFFCFFILLI